jgi:hypothetical protein
VALASSLFGGAKAPIPLLNSLALGFSLIIKKEEIKMLLGDIKCIQMKI